MLEVADVRERTHILNADGAGESEARGGGMLPVRVIRATTFAPRAHEPLSDVGGGIAHDRATGTSVAAACASSLSQLS
jgi:hypothetical protein